MPYAVSFLVWIGATLALYAAAIARIARDRGAALIACAAPATLACAMVGQNGFLSAALIAGVLLQLEARPLLAGLLLGLLTYKPHFGLLFPIALIFGGYWRVVLCRRRPRRCAILVLSWLITPDSLAAFVAHMGNMSANFLTEGSAGFYKQQSLYGLLRMLGVGDHARVCGPGPAAAGDGRVCRLAVAKQAVAGAEKRGPVHGGAAGDALSLFLRFPHSGGRDCFSVARAAVQPWRNHAAHRVAAGHGGVHGREGADGIWRRASGADRYRRPLAAGLQSSASTPAGVTPAARKSP